MNLTKAFNAIIFLNVWVAASTWMLCWALGVEFSARLVAGAMIIYTQVLFVVASCAAVVVVLLGAARVADEKRKRENIQQTAKKVLDQLNDQKR